MKKSNKLYKTLGINPATAQPGDLMRAAQMRQSPMAKALMKKHSKKKTHKKKMTLAEDTAYDRKHGIKEHSPEDMAIDRLHGVKDKKRAKKAVKKTDGRMEKSSGMKCKTCGKKHGKDVKHKAHPGFASVQASIARRSGVSKERAGAILAASTRGASARAKRANPRLRRVKGK